MYGTLFNLLFNPLLFSWSDEAYEKFTSMLMRVYYPKLYLLKEAKKIKRGNRAKQKKEKGNRKVTIQRYKGSGANGNWELSMIDGLFGIAVLTDNQTTFDIAASLWRQRYCFYSFWNIIV